MGERTINAHNPGTSDKVKIYWGCEGSGRRRLRAEREWLRAGRSQRGLSCERGWVSGQAAGEWAEGSRLMRWVGGGAGTGGDELVMGTWVVWRARRCGERVEQTRKTRGDPAVQGREGHLQKITNLIWITRRPSGWDLCICPSLWSPWCTTPHMFGISISENSWIYYNVYIV